MSPPLTPPGCDLRGLPYFPVDVARLRDSDLWQLSTPEQFKAAFGLWCRSWLEVPAASLPDDEAWLARAAGVALDDWRRLAPMALRGWTLCNDGRLYHAVIAERACRAWLDRLMIQEKSAKGNAARYSLPFDPAPWTAKRLIAAQCLALLADQTGASLPQGGAFDPSGTGAVSPGTVSVSEGEEKGKGKEKGNGRGKTLVGLPSASPTRDDVLTAFDLYNEEARTIGLPVARDLTEARRRKIAARLKTGGLERWREVLAALSRSGFCQGKGPRGWVADLDFVVQETSFSRLHEGAYEDRVTPSGGGGASGGGTYMDLALQEASY